MKTERPLRIPTIKAVTRCSLKHEENDPKLNVVKLPFMLIFTKTVRINANYIADWSFLLTQHTDIPRRRVFHLERSIQILSSDSWCGPGRIQWRRRTRADPAGNRSARRYPQWTCPSGNRFLSVQKWFKKMLDTKHRLWVQIYGRMEKFQFSFVNTGK